MFEVKKQRQRMETNRGHRHHDPWSPQPLPLARLLFFALSLWCHALPTLATLTRHPSSASARQQRPEQSSTTSSQVDVVLPASAYLEHWKAHRRAEQDRKRAAFTRSSSSSFGHVTAMEGKFACCAVSPRREIDLQYAAGSAEAIELLSKAMKVAGAHLRGSEADAISSGRAAEVVENRGGSENTGAAQHAVVQRVPEADAGGGGTGSAEQSGGSSSSGVPRRGLNSREAPGRRERESSSAAAAAEHDAIVASRSRSPHVVRSTSAPASKAKAGAANLANSTRGPLQVFHPAERLPHADFLMTTLPPELQETDPGAHDNPAHVGIARQHRLRLQTARLELRTLQNLAKKQRVTKLVEAILDRMLALQPEVCIATGRLGGWPLPDGNVAILKSRKNLSFGRFRVTGIGARHSTTEYTTFTPAWLFAPLPGVELEESGRAIPFDPNDSQAVGELREAVSLILRYEDFCFGSASGTADVLGTRIEYTRIPRDGSWLIVWDTSPGTQEAPEIRAESLLEP